MSEERDSVNWAKGRGFQRSPIFATTRVNLTRDTPSAVIQSTLLQGTKGELRNHEEVSQALSQLILPGIEPATPISQIGGNHQILSQKELLQAVGLLLWLEALVQTQ